MRILRKIPSVASGIGLLLKERICSLWEQILSFKRSPYFGSYLEFPLKIAPIFWKQ